jgi:glyoxylase-like metal-dependent hydrolase (beta-lactamase superfamily II)
LIGHKNGIYCVDSGYEGEGVAAIYVIASGGRAAIVDTANNASLARSLDALGELGISRDDVDYILLTHIHLDHAGGAGLYMREMPSARLVVHGRGARHMINPEKLAKGTAEVYGEAEAKRLYGEILPVCPDRVFVPSDGEEIRFGDTAVVCMDTPGHAYHHMAFRDRASNAVFTGDAFGLSCFDAPGGDTEIVMPTTSPVQFDPEAMHKSIDRIAEAGADHLYLAHFGEVRDQRGAAANLHRLIDEHVRIAVESAGGAEAIKTELTALFRDEMASRGCGDGGGSRRKAAEISVEINALGLAAWYAKTQGGTGEGR